MTMQELLLNAGFRETEWENEWTKEMWTIRIFKDEMEVFNESRINSPGVYYKCQTTIENLELILIGINSRIK